MRVLIAAAFLAVAAAAPGAYLAAPYSHGLVAAPVAHLAPALPTISSGDLAAASIDAHVEASDHARAAHDAAREYHDQASELQGRAINAAEDHSWQAIDAVKTAEATLDGQAAGAAPILAKQLVGHSPLAYAAPAAYAHGPAYGHASAVVAQSLHQAHPAPLAYAAPAYAHAPLAYAAPHFAAPHYAAPHYGHY
ncbi:hypothetical protein JYU34_001081 [Plutella xylostella]|uniref:Uncharacterized protein n=2 Tax=Plutella xylostella TaxID=51655 RepID=A0ABQ7R5X7_PLUXY|nr:cuticle protein 38 [Plutella xylostella]KAG7312710.1 hypothetical protein JYU34_001081 [Plutella xylostella]CAG9137040.1 unnamed protein product [Plutella xylostella]